MLYNEPALGQATGGMLRPGGLELTLRLLAEGGLAPGARILDLGCGPGHSVAALEGRYRMTGLDRAWPLLVQAARRALETDLLQAQAEVLPFRDACFDGVLAECVLSLCAEQGPVFTELWRVLRQGGRLFLSDLFLKNGGLASALPAPPKEVGCLLHAAPLEETLGLLARCGFEVLHCADHSQALRQLAGQLIFDQGGLQAFWSRFLDRSDAGRICGALRAAPPGYYALVARKTNRMETP